MQVRAFERYIPLILLGQWHRNKCKKVRKKSQFFNKSMCISSEKGSKELWLQGTST